MTNNDAIQLLDNLRKAVLTVQGQNGPTALTGADHDNFREAVNVLRCALTPKPPEPTKPDKPTAP